MRRTPQRFSIARLNRIALFPILTLHNAQLVGPATALRFLPVFLFLNPVAGTNASLPGDSVWLHSLAFRSVVHSASCTNLNITPG
jgi:hypothetical protein